MVEIIMILAIFFLALGIILIVLGIKGFRMGRKGEGYGFLIPGIILTIINGFIVGIYLYLFIGFSTGLIRLM